MKLLPIRQAAFLLSAATTAITSTTFAAEVFWSNPGEGAFLDGANWDTGIAPTDVDDAIINNEGTATIATDDDVTVSRLIIDAGSVVQSGGAVTTIPFGTFESPGAFAIGSAEGLSASYTITGDSALYGGRVRIGYAGGNGSLSIEGSSSYNGAASQDTWVGDGAGSVGSFTMKDSAQWNISGDWFVVGRGGAQGTVNITGTEDPDAPKLQLAITGNGNFVFGDGAGGSAVANISGRSQIFTTGGEIWVGNAGSRGELNLGGSATMVAEDHWIAIGRRGGVDGSEGIATISGNAQLRKEGANNGRRFTISDGAGSQGTLIVKDSALVSSSQHFQVGRNGGTGTLTVQDSATVNISGQLWVGDSDNATASHGTINLEGGTINVNDWVAIGRDGAGSGTLKISGGTFNKNGNGNFILNGATAILEQTGGALNVNSGQTWLSEMGGKNSTWTATGGTANLGSETQIGRDSVATMTIGGTADYTNQGVILGFYENGNGTLNLNGGIFTANSIAKGAGSGTVKFNGGVLRAGTASADYFAGFDAANLQIQSGGLKFDTNTHDVFISQALSGEGGLTKMGAGTLTLLGATTFTGFSAVEAGVLEIDTGAALGGVPHLDIAAGAGLIVHETVSLNENIVLTLLDGSALTLDFDGEMTIAALWINGEAVTPDTYTLADLQALPGDVDFDGDVNATLTVTSTVPEPGTLALLACGAAFATWRLRRRR